MNDEMRTIAEECLKGGIHVEDITRVRQYVEGFLAPGWLDSKSEAIEYWAKTNSDPFLLVRLLHRPYGFNKLAAAILAVRRWESWNAEEPGSAIPEASKWLLQVGCCLAIVELTAGESLDDQALNHLQDRLQDTDGMYGMVHELQTYSYFARKGLEVEPSFLAPASRAEMAVILEGQRVPIQCKCKAPGAGRSISRDSFMNLSGSIAVDAGRAGERVKVNIGTTGPISQANVEFLRNQIRAGVGRGIGPEIIQSGDRVFTVHVKHTTGTFTEETIRGFLSEFKFEMGMAIGNPIAGTDHYDVVAVVGLDAPRDTSRRTWRSLHDSIITGAKQLTDGPPGIVAIHYADPVSDFETLRPTEYQMGHTIAQRFGPMPHMGAVMLSAEPDLQLPSESGQGAVRTYIIDNRIPAELLGESVH